MEPKQYTFNPKHTKLTTDQRKTGILLATFLSDNNLGSNVLNSKSFRALYKHLTEESKPANELPIASNGEVSFLEETCLFCNKKPDTSNQNRERTVDYKEAARILTVLVTNEHLDMETAKLKAQSTSFWFCASHEEELLKKTLEAWQYGWTSLGITTEELWKQVQIFTQLKKLTIHSSMESQEAQSLSEQCDSYKLLTIAYLTETRQNEEKAIKEAELDDLYSTGPFTLEFINPPDKRKYDFLEDVVSYAIDRVVQLQDSLRLKEALAADPVLKLEEEKVKKLANEGKVEKHMVKKKRTSHEKRPFTTKDLLKQNIHFETDLRPSSIAKHNTTVAKQKRVPSHFCSSCTCTNTSPYLPRNAIPTRIKFVYNNGKSYAQQDSEMRDRMARAHNLPRCAIPSIAEMNYPQNELILKPRKLELQEEMEDQPEYPNEELAYQNVDFQFLKGPDSEWPQ